MKTRLQIAEKRRVNTDINDSVKENSPNCKEKLQFVFHFRYLIVVVQLNWVHYSLCADHLRSCGQNIFTRMTEDGVCRALWA